MPRIHGSCVVLLLLAVACGDDSTSCNLDTAESGDIGGTVTYRAEKTGDGVVSSLTYATDTGPQLVPSPILPYMQTVTLTSAHARLQATGSVTNGSITISYSASGGPEQQQAMCSASN